MSERGKGTWRVGPNRLAGILGVASLWGVDPTVLARCTDGDWATPTGTGTKVLGAAGYYGQIDFDMGAVYNVIITMKLLYGNTIVGGGDVGIYLSISEGAGYYLCPGQFDPLADAWAVNFDSIVYLIAFARARNIRLAWHGDGAGTWNGAVYEIEAIQL